MTSDSIQRKISEFRKLFCYQSISGEWHLLPAYTDSVDQEFVYFLESALQEIAEEARKEEGERISELIESKLRIGNDGAGKPGSTHNQKRKATNKVLKEILSSLTKEELKD